MSIYNGAGELVIDFGDDDGYFDPPNPPEVRCSCGDLIPEYARRGEGDDRDDWTMAQAVEWQLQLIEWRIDEQKRNSFRTDVSL